MDSRQQTPARAGSASSAAYAPADAQRHSDASLEATVTRRVTLRITPLLFVLYVACFLDRTNVGFAALQMNRDLGFSPAVYGLGAGVFFLAYAMFEVPANLLLVRFGARRWLARIAISWGAVAAAMMFVRSPASFYVMRFLLGVAEAGAFPGIVYYLTQWFPEAQRARAMSRFMIAVPIAGAIGGALGGALLSLDGRMGLAGWQWLFLLEGLPAVALGIATLFLLPDQPQDAKWLPAHERRWLLRRLADEHAARGRAGRASLRETLTSPAVWKVSLPYFLMSLAIYAVLFFQPTVLKEVARFGTGQVSLALTLTGLTGALAMLVVGVLSDRRRERAGLAATTLCLAAGGCIVAAFTRQPVVLAVALGVAAAAGTAFLPVYWCIPPLLLSASAAAAGIALTNSLGNLGGFVGPAALGAVRSASSGYTAGLLLIASVALVAAFLTYRLRHATRGATPAPG
jgi:sugar phosphate permease